MIISISPAGNSWICAITKSQNRVQQDSEGEPEKDAVAVAAAAAAAAATNPAMGLEDGGGGGGQECAPAPPNEQEGVQQEEESLGVFQLRNRRRAMGGMVGRGLDSIMFGEYLKTSRGLVPRSALQPTPYAFTSPSGRRITLKRDNILPTDEGSRIGVIYLPRVSVSWGWEMMGTCYDLLAQGDAVRVLRRDKHMLWKVSG